MRSNPYAYTLTKNLRDSKGPHIRGHYRPRKESALLDKHVQELFNEGVTYPREISKRLQVTHSRIENSFRRLGLPGVREQKLRLKMKQRNADRDARWNR